MDAENRNDKSYHQAKRKPKAIFFLGGCFGFSREQKKPSKMVQDNGRDKHLFSWSKFRLKRQAGTKSTLNSAVPDKTQTKKITSSLKHKRKFDDDLPPTSQNSDATTHNKIISASPILTSTSDQPSQDRPQKSYGEKIVHENGKLGTPNAKLKSKVHHHSTSFPVRHPPEKSPARSKRRSKENGRVVNKNGSIIGMSIIAAALFVTVLWGRLCAILCTSAWLYLVPRLVKQRRGEILKYGTVLSEPDLNSDEYKKRVVLEGFLERKQRSSL